MANSKLLRTSYDPSPSNGQPRPPGAVQDSEAFTDFNQYSKPLEQTHGSNLHGWGIASGLKVTATPGASSLQVTPGVALDSSGQHISLAPSGFFITGPNSSPSDGAPPPVVTIEGVSVPTAGLTGSLYLTIQFNETFDNTAFRQSGGTIYQMDHTPWIQLQPVAGFDNKGMALVLAAVTLDPSGNVLSLAPGLRQGTALELQRLSVRSFQVPPANPAAGVDSTEIGALQPRAAGGMTIVADTLGLQTTAGLETWVFDNANSTVSHVGNFNAQVNNAQVNGELSVAGPAALMSAVVQGDVSINGNLNMMSNGTVSTGVARVGTLFTPYIIPPPGPSGTANTSLTLSSPTVHATGSLYVGGTLTKAAGSFKIDHPLDPENKFLSHSFVESPDMLNVYNGIVTTDGEGSAVVRLPAYFEALNRDYRYQLTVIGDQFAQAIVSREVCDNVFAIRTDKRNVKVSWQVTGVRQDSYANAHRIVVEEDKPERVHHQESR